MQPQCRESWDQGCDGDFKLRIHLAPPLLSRTDPDTGRPVMQSFGPWIFPAFRVLSAFRWIRGRWCDPFRFTKERELNQQMQISFQKTLDLFGHFKLTRNNLAVALRLATWPMQVRGYGPVRAEAFERAMQEREMLEAEVRGGIDSSQKAA